LYLKICNHTNLCYKTAIKIAVCLCPYSLKYQDKEKGLSVILRSFVCFVLHSISNKKTFKQQMVNCQHWQQQQQQETTHTYFWDLMCVKMLREVIFLSQAEL
jgi:hypothetical protein